MVGKKKGIYGGGEINLHRSILTIQVHGQDWHSRTVSNPKAFMLGGFLCS